MEQNLPSGCAVSAHIIGTLIGLGISLLIPYYLCHINPEIEAGWLRGFWHGGNFVGNLVLSLFDGRLLRAPLHTAAYSVFWWISTVGSCIVWFLYCIHWISKLGKAISGEG
ncbi:MAG: hypothetical protein LBK07_00775 [Tannerella sp.]|jgi:hypothetical protein|nr:hypothetical protein [Tannerella sp.]